LAEFENESFKLFRRINILAFSLLLMLSDFSPNGSKEKEIDEN
tara:strand:- start:550 stop:678 length:129 start_codon:yes stop_codon:yes gene_type:complete